MNTQVTCSDISTATWPHLFSPDSIWLNPSGPEWAFWSQAVKEAGSLTQNSTVSFTAQPDTQRNLDIWLIRTVFLIFFSYFFFSWGGGDSDQGVFTNARKKAELSNQQLQVDAWFWHNVCESHVHSNSVITATQKGIFSILWTQQQP